VSKQAAIYRNGKFHHHVQLKQARECRAFRLRPDGGFDELLQPRSDDSFPLQCGNLLPFARHKNLGEKLHYETPMAGDGNWLTGYTPRTEFTVSSRPRFNLQPIPVAPIRAFV
jgi:hypothetical protein